MANKEISELTSKVVPVGTDEIEIQETGAGLSKKATLQNVLDSVTFSDIDVDGGNIDGTVIGANTPAAASVTTLDASGVITANTKAIWESADPEYRGYAEALFDDDMFTVGAADTVTGNLGDAAKLVFGNFGNNVELWIGKVSTGTHKIALELDSSGNATFDGAVKFDTFGTPSGPATGTGYVFGNANSGLVMSGHGTIYDFRVYNQLNQSVMDVPQGTRDVEFRGDATFNGQISGASKVVLGGSSFTSEPGMVASNDHGGVALVAAAGNKVLLYQTNSAGIYVSDIFEVAYGGSITFDRNAVFSGSVSKFSGSFRIPHVLPELEETHELVHSFVESPRAENLYSGMVDLVDGTATVNIDEHSGMTEGTFLALNHCRSWSSSNESGYAPVKCSMSGNILTIECQDETSTDTVYFEVRGERRDKHMLETEWTDENGKVITEPLKPVVPEPQLVQDVLKVPDMETVYFPEVLDDEGNVIQEARTEQRQKTCKSVRTVPASESWEVIEGKAVKVITPETEEEYDEPVFLEYPKFDENGDPVMVPSA